jgi:hypothetical protein
MHQVLLSYRIKDNIRGNIIEGINHGKRRNGNGKKKVEKAADIPAVSAKRQ